MSFTNSPLVKHTDLSPNCNARIHKIDTITPHVVVGHLSLNALGGLFANKSANASSNYGIDDNGNVGMFVEEKNRSWCTSSASNDHRAVTIEIASNNMNPYAITDKAVRGLIVLCADICKRNHIPKLLWKADKNLIGKVDQQNITVHRWFAAKACPGEYVYSRLGYIAKEVNKILLPPAIVVPSVEMHEYKVMIESVVLNYRKGPGINYPVIGRVHKGEIYTIIKEKFGTGASKWGQFKSGSGWVSLDHCSKVK